MNQDLSQADFEKLTEFKQYFYKSEFSKIIEKLDIIIPKAELKLGPPGGLSLS